MSFKMMALASEVKTGSPTRKLILLMLADRSNEDGLCYPSQNKIAEDCELSRETVNRQIKELEKMGFLEIINRVVDGVKLPNHYKLNLTPHVILNHRGSDGESHKPINKPTKLEIKNLQAFDKLWKDYTLTFLKGFNRGGGSKKKALDGYKTLVKKYSDEEIYGYVENHAGLDFGHKDLERLLKLDLIKQYFEDEGVNYEDRF